MAKKFEIVVTFTVSEADVNEVYENMYDDVASANIGETFARLVDGMMFDAEALDNYLNGQFAINTVDEVGEAATVADIPDTE